MKHIFISQLYLKCLFLLGNTISYEKGVMRTSQDLLHLLKCLIINFIARAMSHTNKKTLHKSSRQADTKTIMLASWKHWECFMLAVIFRHIRLQPLVKAGGTCYFFSTANILRDTKHRRNEYRQSEHLLHVLLIYDHQLQ